MRCRSLMHILHWPFLVCPTVRPLRLLPHPFFHFHWQSQNTPKTLEVKPCCRTLAPKRLHLDLRRQLQRRLPEFDVNVLDDRIFPKPLSDLLVQTKHIHLGDRKAFWKLHISQFGLSNSDDSLPTPGALYCGWHDTSARGSEGGLPSQQHLKLIYI